MVVLNDFSGGRNGSDPPLGPDFAPNQVVDAVNVDWYRTRGARKRNGSSNVSMTGSGMIATASWLGRNVPSTNDADAELWTADDGSPSTIQRLDNSTTWTLPSVTVDSPNFTGSAWEMTCASLNGLFFISYNSSAARLHVYDSAVDKLRRTGIDPGTNAPTVANTGGGAYAAILRYYRVRWETNGITRMSEPTPSVSFTPSGGGTAARVTRPTVPGEGETFWRLEGSTDNVTFYLLAEVAIGTTFFDDSVAPASYSAGALSPATGTFTLQKSYRLIAADQNRLVGWGSWTTSDKQNRMEFSAVIGSRDQGDAERVDTTVNYYLDFDENDSGPPMALVGPLWGNFYAFKSRQMWELSPTGSTEQPYRRTAITKELGCVSSHGACRGEDANGNPCLYIITHRGVYRYGVSGGLNYIGRGIEDLILGPTSTMNMAATKVIGHLVYHPSKRQVWVWFATGSNNDPDTLCVYNVLTGGWARYTGSIATARCSVMFARSIGATMGFELTPYMGSTAAVNRIVKCDDTATNQDAGVSQQAYVTTKPIEPAGPGMRGAISDAVILAPAASGVTLTCTTTPDFGANPTKSGTALLTAAGSETRVQVRMADSGIGSAQFVQLQVGDGSAANNAWSFDRMTLAVSGAEPVTG